VSYCTSNSSTHTVRDVRSEQRSVLYSKTCDIDLRHEALVTTCD
jgi:hypothetical protein